MAVKKATRNNADQFISKRLDFKTGGALSGYQSGTDPINHPGRLPEEFKESFRNSEYRVYSYVTPIAWWSEDRGWERPEVYYSNTTSHHQGKCPRTTGERWWAVVNLDSGKQREERYTSAENVIRYGLVKDTYKPGQYDIYPADRDGIRMGEPVRAYKRA